MTCPMLVQYPTWPCFLPRHCSRNKRSLSHHWFVTSKIQKWHKHTNTCAKLSYEVTKRRHGMTHRLIMPWISNSIAIEASQAQPFFLWQATNFKRVFAKDGMREQKEINQRIERENEVEFRDRILVIIFRLWQRVSKKIFSWLIWAKLNLFYVPKFPF